MYRRICARIDVIDCKDTTNIVWSYLLFVNLIFFLLLTVVPQRRCHYSFAEKVSNTSIVLKHLPCAVYKNTIH